MFDRSIFICNNSSASFIYIVLVLWLYLSMCTCAPTRVHTRTVHTHTHTYTHTHGVFFDSQMFKITMGRLMSSEKILLWKSAAFPAVSTRAQGPPVTMETNMEPLGGACLQSCIWVHLTVSRNAASSPLPTTFEIRGGGKLSDYK